MNQIQSLFIAVPLLAAAAVAAFASETPARTVDVAMDDNMRFTPNELVVKQGETLRFVVRNRGKLMHEMVIGTKAELAAHQARMSGSHGMAHGADHGTGAMAHVAPGKTGELVWTASRPGELQFACLVAGHSEAGMTGRIVVRAL